MEDIHENISGMFYHRILQMAFVMSQQQTPLTIPVKPVLPGYEDNNLRKCKRARLPQAFIM
jgi:hypothetical protein